MASVHLFGALALQVVALVTLVLVWCWVRGDRPLHKMDGPKGRIFIGLGLSLPQPASQRLREWAQQYGEIYKIKIGWYNWVVLSSPEAVREVFDKQVKEQLFLLTNCLSRHSLSHVRRKCPHQLVSWLLGV